MNGKYNTTLEEFRILKKRDGTVHTGVLETWLCRLEGLYGLTMYFTRCYFCQIVGRILLPT